MSVDGFVSACVRCGAPQPVALMSEVQRCRHCGSSDPLDPQTRARISGVAKLLSSQQGHTLDPEQAARAGDLGFMALALVGGSFLVAGPMMLLWIQHDLPAGVRMMDFLLTGRAPGLDAYDVTAFWWVLFLFLVIIGLTSAWVGAGQLAIYAILRGLRALPPLVVGGKARCRLCGDELPPEGLVRACRSCKADNLVDGVRFRQAAATLREAIEQAERAAQEAVGRRLARLEGGVMWAAGLPFLVILAMPLSLLLDGPHPELLWVPPALLALGISLYAIAKLIRPRAQRQTARSAR